MRPMAAQVVDPFGLEGSILEGRYEVHGAVARGGFGVVYRGRDIGLGAELAIKVLCLPPTLGPEERAILCQNFQQEARTTALLKHPAIVRAAGFGVSRMPNGQELPWMAMEWIDGGTLADALRARDRPMAPAEALALLRPVIDALASAHDQEPPVAHRDVKPANILVEEARGRSSRGLVGARLLDFGIAKSLEPDERAGSGETHTRALFAAFSLPYAAPEQKSGMRTGPWTDVHAVGLVLTQMLTSCAPYGEGTPMDVELRVLSHERPTPARFGVDVGGWEPVLAKAVARQPAERFQHAGELLDALEQALPTACHLPRNVPGATEPVRMEGARPSAPVGLPSMPPPPPDTFSAATSGVPPLTAPAGRRALGLAAGAIVVVGLAVLAGQALRSVRTLRATTAAFVAPPRSAAPRVEAPPRPPAVVTTAAPMPSAVAAAPTPEAVAPTRRQASPSRQRAPRVHRGRSERQGPTHGSDGFEGM
jgi:serine/threonine protein kinase